MTKELQPLISEEQAEKLLAICAEMAGDTPEELNAWIEERNRDKFTRIKHRLQEMNAVAQKKQLWGMYVARGQYIVYVIDDSLKYDQMPPKELGEPSEEVQQTPNELKLELDKINAWYAVKRVKGEPVSK
jgi:hypothetical protein